MTRRTKYSLREVQDMMDRAVQGTRDATFDAAYQRGLGWGLILGFAVGCLAGFLVHVALGLV